MTATMERAAVVMTTADGESRPAEMWGQDSWTCGFCQTPTFGPADWEQHERDNAECHARQGESYEPEPYAGYRRGYWERQQCSNPGCVTALTGDLLRQYRQREAERREREERHARWQREQDEAKLMAQLEAEAKEAKYQRRVQQGPVTRETAVQLGFAWHCFAGEHEHNGTDRDEWVTHQRGHGLKALTPSVKRVRLRRKPPVAALPKLEVNPFKWAHWHQEHTEPGICECGHGHGEHRSRYGASTDETSGCGQCACTTDAWDIPTARSEADRRGQYLANGPSPHSVWVIPFEAAPWEDSRAEPVLLYAGSAGRYFTDAWRAKSDRR